MRTVIILASHKPASSVSPYSSVVAGAESSAKVVVGVSIDDRITRKEAAVCPYDPQTYRLDEARIAILQVDKVQSLLSAVLAEA